MKIIVFFVLLTVANVGSSQDCLIDLLFIEDVCSSLDTEFLNNFEVDFSHESLCSSDIKSIEKFRCPPERVKLFTPENAERNDGTSDSRENYCYAS